MFKLLLKYRKQIYKTGDLRSAPQMCSMCIEAITDRMMEKNSFSPNSNGYSMFDAYNDTFIYA